MSIAKGQRVESHEIGPKTDLEPIVTDMLGRTGNLRAPVLRVKGALYVGFPRAGFADLIG